MSYWDDHPGFPAKLDRVVDGDTIDMIVDQGFRTRYEARIRLLGVDTAEIYGVSHTTLEYQIGQQQAEWVYDWFVDNAAGDFNWPFLAITDKDSGKYGRWPGVIVSRSTGNVLNEDIIAEYPDTAYET